MPYNEKLADTIRTALTGTKNLVEKKMFGGIAFIVNDKMCIGVDKDDIMLRCEVDETDELLKKKGARIFDLSGGRPRKGWLLVIVPKEQAVKKILTGGSTKQLKETKKLHHHRNKKDKNLTKK